MTGATQLEGLVEDNSLRMESYLKRTNSDNRLLFVPWISYMSAWITHGLGEEDSLFGTQLELLGRVGFVAVVEPGGQAL